MIFSRSFVLALFSAATSVLAQNPNPFIIPTSGLQVTAGQPFTLNWNATTSGTVTLVLRSGASSDLADGEVIASSITNSGTYTWDVPSTETRGSDYTIEIVSDSDPTETNYTPYFVLESTNTVAQSLTSVSIGAPSTSLSMSTASVTASPTTTGTGTDSSSTTGSSSTTLTSTGSMTTSASGSSQAGLVQTGTSTGTNAGARATAMVGMLGAVALGALAL